MSFNLIIRIALLGIIISIINLILKQTNRDEHAYLINLAGIILVLLWILPYITELFYSLQDLFNI